MTVQIRDLVGPGRDGSWEGSGGEEGGAEVDIGIICRFAFGRWDRAAVEQRSIEGAGGELRQDAAITPHVA